MLILILIILFMIIMIKMNMQNKLYTTQFYHHPIIDWQPVPKQQSWNVKIRNPDKFQKKFELLDKEGFKLKEI